MRPKWPKQARGVSISETESQEHVLSDEEFKPKPLTRKERLTLNVSVTVVVLAVLAMGSAMLYFHTDAPSAYQTAAPAAAPAKKI
jgi:hypothetical protein